jgi:hypothetical protein
VFLPGGSSEPGRGWRLRRCQCRAIFRFTIVTARPTSCSGLERLQTAEQAAMDRLDQIDLVEIGP